MKKIFFVSVLMTLAITSCQNKKNTQQPNNTRLVGSWTTVHKLIPELTNAQLDLDENNITVNEFKKELSFLLQAYSFFFASLQKKSDLKAKYYQLVQFVSSLNKSESKSDMLKVYFEVSKFNTEWASIFYTESTLY